MDAQLPTNQVTIKSSARQLAVNGGKPVFEVPIHVGRPNIVDPDRFLGLVRDSLDRRWLTNDGPLVRQFEELIASYVGADHCIAMSNGTAAMQCLARALDLSGEVIVPSFTFVATAHAMEWMGLRPVFADVDPMTHNLDPLAVRARIGPRTSAILPVHLWGRPANVDAYAQLSAEFNLPVIYDAAHAFGASVGGVKIGSFGRAEVFSFHATKFLNSLEGGAVVTNDGDLAARLRQSRNFGFAGLDDVQAPGTNAKLIEAAAAMGIANLEGVDGIIAKNRGNHSAYNDAMREIPGISLLQFDMNENNNFQYVVGVLDPEIAHDRDRVVATLHAENVLARRYFWPGCHRMEPYVGQAHGDLSVTDDLASRVIVLPTGFGIGKAEIEAIASVISLCKPGCPPKP